MNDSVAKFWKYAFFIMFFLNFVLLFFYLFKFNILESVRDTTDNIDAPIVFSLTLLQTFIALGAFGGFFLIRNSAQLSARSEAERTVKSFASTDDFEKIVIEALKDPDIQSKINRHVAEAIRMHYSEPFTDQEIHGLVFGAGEEDGDADE